jgi:hypothetical protein
MSYIFVAIKGLYWHTEIVQLIQFRNSWYSLVFTDHATARMIMRAISAEEIVEVIETGMVKPKDKEGKFWVYKHFEKREDNLISVSLAAEGENLVVITVLVSWRVQS